MPDGTDVITTATDGSVGSDQSNTAQTSAVSTQASAQTAKPSDAELRIRNLQSELDKARARLDALTIEKASLANAIDTAKTEKDSAIAVAAEATRAAMAKAEQLERENATLRAKAARAEFLVTNPDIAPFASLVPSTEDQQQLDQIAQQIRAARQADLDSMRATVRSGGAVVPPASPARPGSGPPSPADINKQLKEAMGKPAEFERLLRELAAKLPQQT